MRRLCNIDKREVKGKLMPRTQQPHRKYIDNLCDPASYFCTLVYSLKCHKLACAVLGEDTAEVEEYIKEYSSAACEYMDEEKRMWRQWEEPERCYLPVAQGLAYLAGLCTEAEYKSAIVKMKDLPTTAYPDAGLSKYWLLKGMFASGAIQMGLETVRKMWGALLDKGETTCSERWDHEYMGDIQEDISLSACHGWSAGAAPLLIEYILGVQAVEPGYRKIKIQPKLFDLDFVEGEVPTVHGIVYVKATKDGIEYRLPEGVELVK